MLFCLNLLHNDFIFEVDAITRQLLECLDNNFHLLISMNNFL